MHKRMLWIMSLMLIVMLAACGALLQIPLLVARHLPKVVVMKVAKRF